MLTLDFIAQRMGGEISANQVKCPGPGHSPKDRSLCIKVEPSAPGGLIVYSHAQDDNLKCKDFVFRKIGNAAVPITNMAHQWRRGVAIKDSKGI